jgi:hypothetical protein
LIFNTGEIMSIKKNDPRPQAWINMHSRAEQAVQRAERAARIKAYLEINSNGYTNDNGEAPDAACVRCGGWSSTGAMSFHYDSTAPVDGRFGCKVACSG